MTFWLSSQSRKRWEEGETHETYKCTLMYVFKFIGRMRCLLFISRAICALKSKQITYTCTLKIIEISDCDSMITFPNISRDPGSAHPQIPWTNNTRARMRMRGLRYEIRPKDTDTHAPRIRRRRTPTRVPNPYWVGFLDRPRVWMLLPSHFPCYTLEKITHVEQKCPIIYSIRITRTKEYSIPKWI